MKKKAIAVAWILALSTGLTWAQSVQNVVVKEYNARNQKTPLAEVGVTVTNAGAVMSDAEGRAALRFRTLKAGDRVQVRRIEKAGYEVFNLDAVEQWAVSPNTEFQLVLCRSDHFRQLRDQYQRVASQSYDRQFRAEQQRLANERKAGKLAEEEFQQRLQDLQDQYDQQLEDLENYVDKFARIDLSELSAQEQELVTLVQEGRIEDAIALYEQRDYLGQYERETRDISEIDRAQARLAELEAEKRNQREVVLASIERQVNTYQLAGGRENFAKITTLLKGVADADTTNVKAVQNYLEHAIRQEDFAEVERYQSIYLRHAATWQERADAYTYLYIAYSQLGKNEQASSYIDEIIALYRDPNNQDASAQEQGLIYALWMKQGFLFVQGNYDGVAALDAELLPGLDRLASQAEADDASWVLRRALAMVRSAFAQLVTDGDVQRAEDTCARAYKECQGRVNTKYEDEVIAYINVIKDYMLVYEVQEKWNEQLPLLEENAMLCRELYHRNPEANAMVAYETLSNLLDTYVQNDMLDKAQVMMVEIAPIQQEISQKYGNAKVRAVLDMCYYDAVAMYHQKRGDRAQCADNARLCLEAFDCMPEEMKEGYTEVRQRWQDLVQP